jgi:hypothetical protein
VIIDSGGVLQTPAHSLPPTVTDNGLVQFTQTVNGIYTGLIIGTGSAKRDGAGTLTLAPTATGGNAYSGGTVLTQGMLSASADNVLGGATGGVTFNGGKLQSSRYPADHGRGGRRHDRYAGFQSTITQNNAGSGALTKGGSGSLILDGVNTYVPDRERPQCTGTPAFSLGLIPWECNGVVLN